MDQRASESVHGERCEAREEAASEGEGVKPAEGEADSEGTEEEEDVAGGPEASGVSASSERTNIEEVGAEQLASGLRRRNRPE